MGTTMSDDTESPGHLPPNTKEVQALDSRLAVQVCDDCGVILLHILLDESNGMTLELDEGDIKNILEAVLIQAAVRKETAPDKKHQH
jgi:hypothetical protein